MEAEFDIKQVLRVFQKILDNGQKVDGVYKLAGMTAESDFDGYNIIMSDGAVTLHVAFHNTHKFECRRSIELEAFMEKIKYIDKLDLS